eukprot:bmy_17379T0
MDFQGRGEVRRVETGMSLGRGGLGRGGADLLAPRVMKAEGSSWGRATRLRLPWQVSPNLHLGKRTRWFAPLCILEVTGSRPGSGVSGAGGGVLPPAPGESTAPDPGPGESGVQGEGRGSSGCSSPAPAVSPHGSPALLGSRSVVG